jgi:hypothetical protein
MSAWGKLDNVSIRGNVVVSTANGNAVLGVNSEFVTNVRAGDYITIASNKYQVDRVISNTSLWLTFPSATTTVGAIAYVQQGPKYISNANVVVSGSNVYTIQKIYGVDRVEANVTSNKQKGIHHPGWVYYNTYTTTQGATRNKAEVLVAMSKNFASNATGVLFGTGAGTDANDNSVVPNS